MADIQVAGLVTKISIDDGQLEQSMASLNRQMQVVKSQANVTSSGFNTFGNSTVNLKNKSETLSKQLEIQGTRVAKLHAEFNDEEKAKERSTEQTHRLQLELNKAVIEYNNLEAQLKNTNKELAIQESSWIKIGNNMETAGKRMQDIGKGMQSTGKNLSTYVTAPIVAAGAGIIKLGSDFEKTMVGSTAIMGDVTDTMRKDMETAAREVGKTTRFGAMQAAEAFEFLALAGLDANQSISALPQVAAFAQAGKFNLARATDLATDSQSALGLASENAGENLKNLTRVTDVLTLAATQANANTEQFAEALTEKAGVALRNLNKDIEEGVAALAIFADQGTKGSAAGTALNATLEGLSRNAIVNKDVFKEYKVEIFDTEGNMRNLADITEQMEKSLGSMSTEEQRATLMKMGFNRQALNGMQMLMGNSEAMREYETGLRNAGGVTQEVADKQINNLQDQLGIMKDRVVDSALTMYDTLAPTIKDVVIPMLDSLLGNLERATEWFANLDESTQRNIIRWVGFAAAAGPVLMVTGKLVGSVGTLTSVLGKGAKYLGAKTAAMGLATKATTGMAAATASTTAATTASVSSVGMLKGAVGLLAGPVGIAVAAIAALGTGAYFLHKNMKQDAIPAVREFGEEVSGGTTKAINGFMDLYDKADVSIKQLSWSSQAVSKEMADSLSNNFSDMSNQIVASLENSREEGIESLQRFFTQSKNISEKEQQEAIKLLNESYDERIVKTQEMSDRITEIYQNAAKENRNITEQEQKEIDRIRIKMKETAVQTMSENELEQRAILERMRRDSNAITARQAADVVKNSVDQRNKTIAEAEKQYNETIKQFIFMRDVTGEISADQADRWITEAKRQKTETVNLAQDMHKDVVKEAQLQAKEHVKHVDWETGEVLSKWRVLYNNVTGWLSNIGKQKSKSISNIPIVPRTSGVGGASEHLHLDAFDDGGIVPGPIGAPRVILAHGGETVLPTHKSNVKIEADSQNQERLVGVLTDILAAIKTGQKPIFNLNGREIVSALSPDLAMSVLRG